MEEKKEMKEKKSTRRNEKKRKIQTKMVKPFGKTKESRMGKDCEKR